MPPPKRKDRDTIKDYPVAVRYTEAEYRAIEDYQEWYDLKTPAEAIRQMVKQAIATFKEEG